jgi:hypothetical protein
MFNARNNKHMKYLLLPTIIGILLALQVRSYFPPLFEVVQGSTRTQITIQRKLTDTEIIAKTKHPEEILVLWTLESSQGKNDGCRAIGKWNGFGMAQSTHTWQCFDSFEEVVGKVDAWLTQRDLEAYCYYNVGIRTTNCDYAKKVQYLLEP